LHARNSARKNKVEKEKKGRREQKKQKIKSTKSSPEFHSKSKWAIKCLEYSLQQRGGGGKRSKQEQIIPHPHAGQRTRKRCKLQNRSASAGSLGCPKIKQQNKRLNLASKKKKKK
jgi:hypothetical protein